MLTKVIGLECVYSSSIVEIPFSEKAAVEVGDEVVFKDAEDREEYAVVRYVDQDAEDEDKIQFAGKILRKATANDIQKVESLCESAKQAMGQCADIINQLGLDMSVFRAGYSFDGDRAHFMFTSEDRVDFRDLVKELARVLQKQIHLRQIGPRDKAKIVGGYGKCGRVLCCSSWLGKLESINMEMVRAQALESKGSSKLSGACGKLLCCLKYEVEAYKDLRKNLPRIGMRVAVRGSLGTGGSGTVIALDVLNQRLKVAFESGESLVVSPSEIVKEV